MKIERKTEKVLFRDIAPGDVFEVDSAFYMKIESQIEGAEDLTRNAVDLSNGLTFWLFPYTPVNLKDMKLVEVEQNQELFRQFN